MSRWARQTQPSMYFIGVTTAKSAICRVFPRWMQALGRPDVQLVGADFRLHDEPTVYRALIVHIRTDPLSLGALVTSHKVSVFEAARELFDELDDAARICGEVSSIAKRNGRLEGLAVDPVTSGHSLAAIIDSRYFSRTGAEVLCLGAGGSTMAIVFHLLHRPDRPRRIVAVNRSPGRLDRLRQMVSCQGGGIHLECHCHTDARLNDALLAALPPSSIVINATGMGKDLPGSPLTDEALFPERGVAWELNYRGELRFLHQAYAQRLSRGLRVEDGWNYFLHGWIAVISHVLDIVIDSSQFARLSEIAGALRR